MKPFKERKKEYQKEYYEKNKEKIRKYQKEYRKNNKERTKEYYEKNKEKIKEYQKEYRKRNSDKVKKLSKKYYENNKERVNKRHKKYLKDNKDSWNKYQNEYKKQKYKEMSLEEKKKFNFEKYSYKIRKKLMNNMNDIINNIIQEDSYSNLSFDLNRIKNERLELNINVKDYNKSYSYTQRKKLLEQLFDTAKTEIYDNYSDRIELKMSKGKNNIVINLKVKENK